MATDHYNTSTTLEGMVELYTQLAGIYHTLRFAVTEGPPLEHHRLVHEAVGLLSSILNDLAHDRSMRLDLAWHKMEANCAKAVA